ncbi:MAG: Holliday junction resolvase RuvX [Anaerolineae bacterium]
MSRFLALDVGDERVGLAISDEQGLLARPLEVVARVSGSASYLHICAVIKAQGIESIIVGWPLTPDGTEGAQVRSTAAYLRGLAKFVTIPIVRWDERSSTNEADAIMSQDGASRRRARRNRDAVAAAVILQHYLDNKTLGVAW